MRDAINIKNISFTVNGNSANVSDIWLTQNGEIYVSLHHNSVWLNVPVNKLKDYIVK